MIAFFAFRARQKTCWKGLEDIVWWLKEKSFKQCRQTHDTHVECKRFSMYSFFLLWHSCRNFNWLMLWITRKEHEKQALLFWPESETLFFFVAFNDTNTKAYATHGKIMSIHFYPSLLPLKDDGVYRVLWTCFVAKSFYKENAPSQPYVATNLTRWKAKIMSWDKFSFEA